MLDCLNAGFQKVEKLSKEYTHFNFKEPGVKTGFMNTVYPLFIQAQIFSMVGNQIDIHSDQMLMLAIAEYPDTYIPTGEEVIKHLTRVNEFVSAVKGLDDLLLPYVKYSGEFTYDKLRSEYNYVSAQNPLVPTKTPAPPILFLKETKLEQKKNETQQKVKQPKYDDEGVSFFTNIGCFKK